MRCVKIQGGAAVRGGSGVAYVIRPRGPCNRLQFATASRRVFTPPAMDFQCQWTALQGPFGRWMGIGLALTGTISAVLSGWLAGALLATGRRLRREAARPAAALAAAARGAPPAPPAARLLLLALALAALARALLAGFPFAAASALAGRWVFGRGCCVLFAALRVLLEAAQRFGIALLAMERYLLSQGSSKESLCLRQYLWAIAVCWAAATAWVTAPLLGWGRFGCDVTAFWCEVDWRPDGGTRGTFNISFLLLGFVTPELIAWFAAMTAVCRSCRPFISTVMNNRAYISEMEERDLDKMALLATCGQLLCVLPSMATQALLLSGERSLPMSLRVIAPLATEILPSVPTLALLVAGRSVRGWLIGTSDKRRLQLRGKSRRPPGAVLLRSS